MMICVLLLIGLLAVAFYLAFRLFTLQKALEKARKELGEISEELFENRVIKLAVPDRKLEELLETVNENLRKIRTERKVYQQNERKLKEQIENISHDLRTPLTAVIGYLKMIDADKLGEEDREFLKIAIHKSYTLQELTGQFYELSRVTSHEFTLEKEVLDGTRILKETCLENYSLLEKAGLDLTLPDFEKTMMIEGNREALNRVFCNLIQNSIRYAKEELRVRIQEDEDKKTVRFVFSNDIDPEQEIENPELLFERFYMQEESRSHAGTGLGLTISRTLTEHMGGHMWAEYSGDQGKRFLTFYIQFHRC